MDYKDFLAELDTQLARLFETQNAHIRCKPGCSKCCETGDYPMSRLDMEHIMSAFVRLDAPTQERVRANIAAAQGEYACPFLIDNLCAVYEHRGVGCRTHGLAYLQDGTLKLPQCVHEGLNYSDVFNPATSEVALKNPITTSLRIDDILQQFGFQPEVIRPLVEWFN
jgi:Fe-S-cluster containining protein